MPAQPARSVTIASGTKPSTAFGTGQGRLGSFQLGAFTGASVTVKVSNDGSNWTTCPTVSGESNPITVSANGAYALPEKVFNFQFGQLVSASNEAEAREIAIFTRD
jgi:hypothetical protein